MEKIAGFQGDYRFLSNFWIVNLRIGDMHFTSAEHAYQAAKSLDPQDWANISSCETPGDAKRAGRLLQKNSPKNTMVDSLTKSKLK